MSEIIKAVLNSEEKADLQELIGYLIGSGDRYFLRNQILHFFAEYCTKQNKPAYFYKSSCLGELIHYTHEIILEAAQSWWVIRPRMGSQEIWRMGSDLTELRAIPVGELLELRDRIVNRPYFPAKGRLLEIDFGSFSRYFPTIKDPRNVGQGLEFLNRHLASKLFQEPQHWLEVLLGFLRQHQYNTTSLLLSEKINSITQLSEQLPQALKIVANLPPDEPYQNFHLQLQQLGFEPGWGKNAGRVRTVLEFLHKLIDAPDPAVLEAFISHIPLIFRAVLVSVHGWVAQKGVLGRPDTSGQVVYVLNQARTLENQLQEDIKLSGLDGFGIQPKVIVLTRLIPNSENTTAHEPLEKIEDAENAWILRVPFREFNPNITQNWLSKTEIWPYLETFAIDAEAILIDAFEGNPHLMLGNYSDGNLVAFLLSRRFHIPYGSIAHVLEKPRHLFSNLYWQDLEEVHNFSMQFTADLIAMNGADFILTSTYQEIVGTPDSVGHYESYQFFTMPELYHVVNGIELFSPKFNVMPPGVNDKIFFPYDRDAATDEEKAHIAEILFTKEDPLIIGHLDNPNLRPIFAIAPLIPVKNLTGLVECFGRSPQLQEKCNLILVAGKVCPKDSTSEEEKGEIEKLHGLLAEYNLKGKVRWIGMRLNTPDTGAVYRCIAARGGIYVHPARFESFGMTILEAMVSGLPVFVTQFGGPAETIQDGDNGFTINPTDLEETAAKILSFISKCEVDPEYWQEISQRGVQGVQDKYNWKLHSQKLLLLGKVYSFWNYGASANREPLLRYLEALFYLIYKPRSEKLLEQHGER
ncbi:MAG: sucrose synthase [Oscillatoriaceae cyanobacterium]